MNKMKVKAAPGMKFPMEDNARKYITTEAVTVENTALLPARRSGR